MKQRIKAELLAILKRVTPGALALWLPVVAFTVIANEVTELEPLPFDVSILHFLHSWSSPGLDHLVSTTTHLGGVGFVTVVSALLALLCYRFVNRRTAYFVVLAAGGSALMNIVLKTLFQRQRPDLWHSIVTENSFSFPSGHSMASSALAFSIMAIFWDSRWRWLAVILGSLYFAYIGLTRMYIGVHFPSDVVAGWCVSLIWVILARQAVRIPKQSSKEAQR